VVRNPLPPLKKDNAMVKLFRRVFKLKLEQKVTFCIRHEAMLENNKRYLKLLNEVLDR
jgi:hypothetical protein